MRQDWRIVMIGDSEVRWGFNPVPIDAALQASGLNGPTLNMGIDGFGSDFYLLLLPYLNLPSHLPALKVAVVGVQLIEARSVSVSQARAYGDIRCEGALQRPILTSALAIDTGMDVFCEPPSIDNTLTHAMERYVATLRYRKALRRFLLGEMGRGEDAIPYSSTALSNPVKNGFQPHQSVVDARSNYEQGIESITAERATGSPAYKPLEASLWPQLVEDGGYFDDWVKYFHDLGIEPVFVALPTNPFLIDFKNRREDYHRNSTLLSIWAKSRNVSFVDLGIHDNYNEQIDYSDHRHLSLVGADKFSQALGTALAQDPYVKAALAGAQKQ